MTELTPALEREMREAAANTGDDGYNDIHGASITLAKLCRTEPDWAASRIKHERGLLGIALAELDRLRAENAASAEAVRELRARVVELEGYKITELERRML